MKLYFRLLLLLLTQSKRTRCTIFGPAETQFRVLPNDLDAFLHVNNGVYLTLMDLGRIDLLLRSNTLSALRKEGWSPVLAAETIRFKKPLRLWQRFSIVTRVLGWDENSVYVEQVFTSKGVVVAKAVVDTRFLSKGGELVSSEKLINFLNITTPSPELPDWVQNWIHSNKQIPTETI